MSSPVQLPFRALLRSDRKARRQRVAALQVRRQLLHVAVLSATGLFFELLLIRWLTAEDNILLAVKNIALIGSFLGLGVGYALAGRRSSSFPAAPALMALLIAAGVGFADTMGRRPLGPAGPESPLGIAATTEPMAVAGFYLGVALLFGLVVLATLPLGQVVGEYMAGLPTLAGYTANVGGSLAGIVLFFVLSAARVPPWAGAGLVFVACVAYQEVKAARVVGVVTAMVACSAMVALDLAAGVRSYWSPYNNITLRELPTVELPDGTGIPTGWVLGVQNHYYQRMLDLRPAVVELVGPRVPLIRVAAASYGFPYAWAQPDSVLVVGAGAGNDVAAALRAGASRVDAVEIDPVILELGRELHPERPYDDPRVRVIETDARRFMSSSRNRYDLVVFGLLDSSASFSALTRNLGLHNYVYTLEAFEAAERLLAPDGVLSLAFFVDQPWVTSRIDRMLTSVFGKPPVVIPVGYDEGVAFVTGRDIERGSGLGAKVGLAAGEGLLAFPSGPLATDDWPFLTLKDRRVPSTLVFASVGVLLVAALLVGFLFRGRVGFDRHLFFLGAGFLLVETRTIAQLGLLYGVTWQVSAIAIAGILVLILAANAVVARWGALPRGPLYLALASGLAANALVAPSAVVGSTGLSAAATVFYLLPLVFASLIFASSVSRRADLSAALASNLIGGVLGGLLENACMITGIAGLSWIAIVVYAASWPRR